MSDVPSNLIPTRITQLPLAPVADENSLMMIVYQGNNYQIRVGDLLSVAGVPTSRQVIAGTGLTGGGQLTSNVTLSVASKAINANLLSDTGVAAGVYGNATNIPVFTVDSTGRVTAVTTIPATVSGYVPVTTQVIAGNGLTGGGPLNGNVTLTASYGSAAPLVGDSSGSAGVATTLTRSDHKHPSVNLGNATQVNGILTLANGGTSRSITPASGAVIWSGNDGLYVGPVGAAGQILISGGTGAPTWGSALVVSDQAANVVYAGPASGPSAPTSFRALVNADLPASGVTANTYGSSNAIPVITVNAKGVITGVSTTTFAYADLAGTIPTWNQNTTGTASNVTGVVALANGGTGQTTKAAAFNALSPVTTTGDLILGNGTNSSTRLGIGANGYLLTSNGTTASWAAAPAGGVTSVTGTAPVVSSGGATPAISMAAANTSTNGYLTSTDWNTFNGKQPAGTYVNSVSGTAGQITSTGGTTPVIALVSGVATPGTTGSATLIPVVTIDTYGRVTGITTAANPQGTVTSVAATVPSFLSISGSPITSSGTLAISYSGTALPIANGGTNSTATATAGGAAYGTGTAYAFTAAGTAGQVLVSAGASAPAWGGIDGGTF